MRRALVFTPALSLTLALLPGPVWAETPLSGSEFDAYTTGKTMTYAQDGTVWGREQYLPGARVIWAFEGLECKRGTWQETAPGLICFAYEDDPDDIECWQFFLDDGRLLAQADQGVASEPLAVIEESGDPLACPGPDVGA